MLTSLSIIRLDLASLENCHGEITCAADFVVWSRDSCGKVNVSYMVSTLHLNTYYKGRKKHSPNNFKLDSNSKLDEKIYYIDVCVLQINEVHTVTKVN